MTVIFRVCGGISSKDSAENGHFYDRPTERNVYGDHSVLYGAVERVGVLRMRRRLVDIFGIRDGESVVSLTVHTGRGPGQFAVCFSRTTPRSGASWILPRGVYNTRIIGVRKNNYIL